MSALSKYERIAAELRAAIRAGTLRPGDLLPSENVLAEEHGVATLTARQALITLRDEGLVTMRRGVGTIVRQHEPMHRHGSRRLSTDQWGSGRSVWEIDTEVPIVVDQLSVHEGTAEGRVAELLAVEPGTAVWVRSRRYLVAGRPVMLAISSLPADLVAGSVITERDTGPGGIYARLRDLGHSPVHFHEAIRGRMPVADEVARLALPPATPVQEIVRRAFAAGGRAVEVNEMVLDASAYVLEYDFDA